MSYKDRRDRAGAGPALAPTSPAAGVDLVPGKRTLVEQAYPMTAQGQIGPAGVQRKIQRRTAERGGDDPAAIHEAAARGIRGPGGALPHLDIIQRAFGRHDVSRLKAHVGPEASAAAGAMGAEAFATGDHVVFDGPPSLHTAAHEAAHAVQQTGAVQLAGGVGQAGDRYEQHADAVADAVVRGQSAEELLDPLAGGGGAAPGVQRRIRIDAIDDGEEFDPEQDYVQSTWGFTPAEKGIYRRWLKDDQAHRYPTKAALKEAIRRVAIQPFGTDIAASYDTAQEQVAIFKQALTAGYRVFDSAATYHTLESLWTAVRELRIPRDELTILYKIKPTDDEALEEKAQTLENGPQGPTTPVEVRRTRADKVSSKLAAARDVLGALPDVLMLHDLDADESVVDGTLKLFAGHVKAGRARALGVSNATVVDLERLRPIAAQAGAPITYVQNRASPYHRDDEVRAYCAEHGLQYMAYGMMGSAQVGACAGVGDEGVGLPTQYLLARHDPRLKAVAAQRGISEGELLIAWAQQRGIAPVAFTSRSDQAQKNFDRAARLLPPEIVTQLDELFVTPSAQASQTVDEMEDTPQKALYAAYRDPTAWYVVDTLREAVGGEALITRVAQAIEDAHDGDGEAQASALKDFALNLVRHVADIQSAIQRMQNERAQVIKSNKTAEEKQPEPEVPYEDWTSALVPMFKDLAAAADAPHVFELFVAWAKRNPLAGHTMGTALEAWPEMALASAPRDDAPNEENDGEVAVEVPTVTLAYGAPDLVVVAGEISELDEGEFVNYQGKLHTVVANDKEHHQLVIKPYG